MAIRFPRALSMATLAATLANGTAFAAQDLRGDCCEPQAKPMAAPLAKTGTRDAYTDGARTGARDPYTDGAAQAVIDARVGSRDPYTDGGLSSPRARDPYTDGAHA